MELGETASEMLLQMSVQDAADLGEAEPRGWLRTTFEFGDGQLLRGRFPHEESKGSWWQLWPTPA